MKHCMSEAIRNWSFLVVFSVALILTGTVNYNYNNNDSVTSSRGSVNHIAQLQVEFELLLPDSVVSTWNQLRAAINAAPANNELYVIHITENLTSIGASPTTAINIPLNRNIILMSDDPEVERILTQTQKGFETKVDIGETIGKRG